MTGRDLALFRLEDRVLFEAAAAASVVEAAETAADPNADVGESERQARDEKDAVKNAPPENPADSTSRTNAAPEDPSAAADVDAQIDKLIQGDLPDSGAVDEVFPEAAPDADSGIGDIADGSVEAVVVDGGGTISTDRELVVIDGAVDGKDDIIAGLKPDQDVLVLDGGDLAELNDYLDANSGVKYSAIHFITAEKGAGEYSDEAAWAAVGEHLTGDGGIFFYGGDSSGDAAGQDGDGISGSSGADNSLAGDISGIGGGQGVKYAFLSTDSPDIRAGDYSLYDGGRTITVNSLEDLAVNHGDDATKLTLRDAIDIVNNGGAGDYVIKFSVSGTITLNSGLGTLNIANGSATITIDGEVGDYNIVIDGGDKYNGTTVTTHSGVRIMSIASGNTVTLANLTLQNAYASGNSYGGAINNQGNLTVEKTLFTGNTAYYGGAISSDGGILKVNGSTFRKNISLSVDFPGGGAILSNNDLTVSNSLFDSNTTGAWGGAISTGVATHATITGSTFTGNKAHIGGAIMSREESFLLVDKCVFKNNSAVNATVGGVLENGSGGAICVFENGTIKNSSFVSNSAVDGGAVYSNEAGGNLTIFSSTFSGNTATGKGGAAYNGDVLMVAGSTFSGNSALNGGAIFNDHGQTCVLNSILTGNSATALLGRDIYTASSSNDGSGTKAYYCLVGDSYNLYYDVSSLLNLVKTGLTSFTSTVGSVIGVLVSDVFETVTGGNAVLNADGTFHIKAGTAAGISGTQTGLDAAGNLVFLNLSTSKWQNCNGGAASGAVSITQYDQIGRNRLGNGTQWSIGAYSKVLEASSNTVSTTLDVVDAYDGLISLREAISYAAENSTVSLQSGVGGFVLSSAIAITKNLTFGDGLNITGPGSSSSIFTISAGKTLTFGSAALKSGILSGSGNYVFNGATSGSATLNTTGSVTFSGSAAQKLYAGTCGALALGGSGVKTLAGSLTASSLALNGTAAAVVRFKGGGNALTIASGGTLTAAYADISNVAFNRALTLDSWSAADKTNTVTGSGNTNLAIKLTADSVSGTALNYGTALSNSTLTATYSIRGAVAADSAHAYGTITTASTATPNVVRDAGNNVISQNVTASLANSSSGYQISNSSVNLTIVPILITVSGITAYDRVYSGAANTAATLNYSGMVLSGLLAGDSLTATATGTFANGNAGVNKTVTISNIVLSGSSLLNYILAPTGQQTSTTATITKAAITVSGITAVDRVYTGSGNTGITLNYSGMTLNGLIAGDVLTASALGNCADGNAGNGKTVTLSNLLLSGASLSNYVLASTGQQTSATVNIGKASVTVSGITASDRYYDGAADTHANLNYAGATINGLIVGDSLSVSGTGNFADGNAGVNKTVTITGLTLTGAALNNYTLTTVQLTTTATIFKAQITVSGITANNRVYNGAANTGVTLNYSGMTLSGLIAGDTLSATASGNCADGNAGNGKTVTLSGLALSGSSLANYVLASSGQQASTTVNIAKAVITVSGITAENRHYEGVSQRDADLNYDHVVLNGLIAGDSLSVEGDGRFADGNAGANKTVTITGLQLQGASAGNYVLASSGQQTSTVATIIKANITVSGITANNRVYDGAADKSAVLNYSGMVLSGLIAGDSLTATANGAFADGNAGVGKTVTLSGLALSGSSLANYVLAGSGQQTSTTATITKAAITVSGITAIDRVYTGSGNTGVTLNYSGMTLNGLISGDVLTASALGNCVDGNAGNSKTVTLSGLTLSGASLSNYTLAAVGQQTSATVNIARAQITVSGITANDRYYDGAGDTHADLNYAGVTLNGLIAGDSLAVSGTGHFADGNAGVNKTVTIAGLTLSGAALNNYILASSGQQLATAATIFKAQITVSGITAVDRIYDGASDTHANLNYSGAVLSGLVAGDSLSITGTGNFADGNAGVGKTVTLSGLTLSGSSLANYVLAGSGQQASTTATITKAAITVSGITAVDRVYSGSGNTGVTLDYSGIVLGGLISGDTLSAAATGNCADGNAGDGKTVTLSGLTLSGASLSNYTLAGSGQQAGTTVNIARAQITVSGIAAFDRFYAGADNTAAALNYGGMVLGGLISGDSLFATASGNFADGNAGANKTVTLSGLTLSGASLANYVLASSGQQTGATATIAKAMITVSDIAAVDRIYTGSGNTGVTLDYSGMTLSGLISGDVLNASALGNCADGNAGDGKTVILSGLTLSGSSLSNYTLASVGQQTSTIVNIGKASVTVSGITAHDRYYDGAADTRADLDYAGVSFSGLIAGDSLTVSGSGSFADGNAGVNKIVTITGLILSGAALNNYILTTVQLTTSATIFKAAITVSGITAEDRIYSGSADTHADLNYAGVIFGGLIAGDSLSVSATGNFADGNAGVNKMVTLSGLTLSGGSAANYELAPSGQQTTTTATIAKAAITVSGITADDRYYNGTGDAHADLNYGGVTLGGLISGDSLSVSATGNFADGNAGVDKTVTITGLTLSGSALGNYILASTGQQTSATATIMKAQITVSGITADDRVYAGSGDTGVVLNYGGLTLGGLISGDDLSATAVGNMADGNAGINKTVTISGLALSGGSSANYELAASGQQNSTSVTIGKAQVTVSGIVAIDRVYGGTADTSVALDYSGAVFTGIISGDSLTVTAAGNMNDGNAGVDKDVTISGITLSGASSANYILSPSGQQTSATVTIAKAAITVSGIAAADRYYNGTGDTHADLNYGGVTFSGLIAGDSLNVSANGSFADGNAGVNKTVTISGIVLSGASQDNYELVSSGPQYTVATITPIVVTNNVTADSKIYDGNTSAGYTGGISGVLAGDDVSLDAVLAYSDRNAGMNKDVNALTWALSGTDAGNYSLGGFVVQHADILAKAVTITVTQGDTVYGTAVNPVPYADLAPGDSFTGELSISGGLSASGNWVAGLHNITQGSLTIDDGRTDGGSNYITTFVGTSFNVAQRTINADAALVTNKVYDGSDTAIFLGGNTAGIIDGDSVTLDAEFHYNSADVLYANTIYASQWSLSGNDSGNYLLVGFTPVAGSISARQVNAVWSDASPYVYNGSDQGATVKAYYTDVNGNRVELTISFSGSGTVFKDPGIYTAGISSANPNYVISSATASRALTISLPSAVNADNYSNGLNWNFISTIPALTGSWLGNGAPASPTLVNPYSMNYSELVSGLEIRSPLRREYGKGIVYGRTVDALGGGEMFIDDLRPEAAFSVFSGSRFTNIEAFSSGEELFARPRSPFSSLRFTMEASDGMGIGGGGDSVQAFSVVPEPVRMPGSFFIDEAGEEDILAPVLDLSHVEAMPRKADMFKNEFEFLLEEMARV